MENAQSPALARLADPEIMALFRDVPTSTISDNLGRLPGLGGLRAFHRQGCLLGSALTVRVRPGDNLAVHEAISLARPGEVIVVDGGGDENHALVGEIMKNFADSRGVAGFVINGAIRDAAVFARTNFPCYARTAVPRGPYKTDPGCINVPLFIGGVSVRPGDIIVGDEDGVVSFAPEFGPDLFKAVRAQEAREAGLLDLIRSGQYDGRYGRQVK